MLPKPRFVAACSIPRYLTGVPWRHSEAAKCRQSRQAYLALRSAVGPLGRSETTPSNIFGPNTPLAVVLASSGLSGQTFPLVKLKTMNHQKWLVRQSSCEQRSTTRAWAVLLLIIWTWTGDVGQGQVYYMPVQTGSGDGLLQEEYPVRAIDFTVSQEMLRDNDVAQTGCTECQPGWIGPLRASSSSSSFICDSCSDGCVPGRLGCDPCVAQTRIGRFAYGLYRAICCPDPCYEPKWLAVADSAFFVEAARPQTQQRLRWDAGLDAILPDRAEYFWARADGQGKGPSPAAGFLAVRRLTYHELSLYTEVGSSGFSVFTDVPYRSLDPTGAPHSAGFSDMNVGTKTLLFDCELLQVSFQFRTHIPMANPRKGLGTGHVSLEPSLLVGLCLGPETYFQGQISEWIPIGGDPDYAGAILHYHVAFNHVLWRPLSDVPLIGTMEFNGWSFQDGAYTDPVTGAMRRTSGQTTLTFGPGLRLAVCDKIDFGTGVAFALQDRHLANVLVRSEFRWRY